MRALVNKQAHFFPAISYLREKMGQPLAAAAVARSAVRRSLQTPARTYCFLAPHRAACVGAGGCRARFFARGRGAQRRAARSAVCVQMAVGLPARLLADRRAPKARLFCALWAAVVLQMAVGGPSATLIESRHAAIWRFGFQ